jgi:hypothetical protein
MARQQSIISSLDQLNRIERFDFDRVPPAELLAEYRELYQEMTRLRRNRTFTSSDLMQRADRERAAIERRVMTMASAVHRRSRAVSVDLHQARDRGPEAVLEALRLAIERHDAQNEAPPRIAPLGSPQRRRLWIGAALVSAVSVLIAVLALLR